MPDCSPAIRWLLPVFLLLVFWGCERRAALPDHILVVGQPGEPRSLDPHTATSSNDFRIAANIYEGLVRFREGTLEIEPSLAESWEISEDGRIYTFRLRPGIHFHDGSPFNSDAVRYNFERMLLEDHPDRDTGPFPLSFFFESIEKIETPDDLTVVFHLDQPFAPFLSNLAYPTGLMISPAAVHQHGEAFGRNPSGTGPFRFAGWESNRFVHLLQNPEYREGSPRLEEIFFRPLTDENARLTELLAGGCDLVMEVPPDVVTHFRNLDGYHILETAGPHLWFLIFNTREGPFADPLARKAVNMAINRKAMIEDLLQNTATEAVGPIPRAFTGAADPDLEPYPHDPEKARQLIQEAGLEGAEVTLFATEGGSGMLAPRDMATAIQADLAKIGLRVKIEMFEWNTFLDRVNSGLEGQADMAQMAWMVNDPDTLPYLALRSDAWPEEGGFNSGYYQNPEVDALIEEARRETDPEKRNALYRQIDRLVHADAPWAFVASWKQNAAASDSVQNLELQPSYLLFLKNTWKGDPE